LCLVMFKMLLCLEMSNLHWLLRLFKLSVINPNDLYFPDHLSLRVPRDVQNVIVFRDVQIAMVPRTVQLDKSVTFLAISPFPTISLFLFLGMSKL
jgi:hypothetical protein